MERIAVGVGGSASRRAVDWVAVRARDHPVLVELVRAWDPATDDPTQERLVAERERNRILEVAFDTNVTVSLVAEDVPDALVDAAAHADLLVIGARRDRPVRAAIHGSVPLRIASRARCATVIVPADWRPGVSGRIVAGLDEEGTSSAALRFAAREAAAQGAQLTIVHAWSMPTPSITDVLPLREDERLPAYPRRILADAIRRVRDAAAGAPVDGVLVEGVAADALADHADGAALVVVGSHRWGPVAGLVLGSTARALLPRTSCVICIVPPHRRRNSWFRSSPS